MKKIEFDVVTTRNGDGGKSSTYSGEVVWKDDLVFELLGNVDELSSWLGILKQKAGEGKKLEQIQRRLVDLGASVATNPRSNLAVRWTPVSAHDVDQLETWEQELLDSGVTIRPEFILPGASEVSAWIDVTRTVCRRTERSIVRFMREAERPDLREGSRYLNRLSDWLFLWARSRDSQL